MTDTEIRNVGKNEENRKRCILYPRESDYGTMTFNFSLSPTVKKIALNP